MSKNFITRPKGLLNVDTTGVEPDCLPPLWVSVLKFQMPGFKF